MLQCITAVFLVLRLDLSIPQSVALSSLYFEWRL